MPCSARRCARARSIVRRSGRGCAPSCVFLSCAIDIIIDIIHSSQRQPPCIPEPESVSGPSGELFWDPKTTGGGGGGTSDNPNVQEFYKNTGALRVVNSFCRTPARGNCRGVQDDLSMRAKEQHPSFKAPTPEEVVQCFYDYVMYVFCCIIIMSSMCWRMFLFITPLS